MTNQKTRYGLRPPVKFEWRGNHHGYYGIFFIVFGIFNYIMGVDNGVLDKLLPFWNFFTLVGIVFLVDDAVEHWVTADTPLRILYEKVFRPLLK